ncbi:imelysin family protein [Vogesella sp. GCM10023246]|uniref:Imelysin family protein n=1 Tax=Vogesella oryzagri TaxID=3160864 RepID=A0ABV1M3U3_9NEIS
MPKTLHATCWLLAGLLPAVAAANTPAEQQFLQQLTQHELLPRYHQVADSSRQLASSIDALCRTPGKAALTTSRQAWLTAYRNWQAVAPLNWGPTAERRSQRVIAFRPTRPALIEAAIGQKLGASAEGYEQAGAAAKGYNAIEYTLYDSASQLSQPARCQWLQRNAAEIASHTPVLLADWQRFAADLTRSGETGAPYSNSKQPLEEVVNLTLAGLNELHKELARIGSVKPEQVIGQRSASGKQLVRTQFALLHAVLVGADNKSGLTLLLADKQPALAAELVSKVAAVESGLQQLPDNLVQVGNSSRAAASTDALEALMDALEGPVTQALDITLSFNESDGD